MIDRLLLQFAGFGLVIGLAAGVLGSQSALALTECRYREGADGPCTCVAADGNLQAAARARCDAPKAAPPKATSKSPSGEPGSAKSPQAPKAAATPPAPRAAPPTEPSTLAKVKARGKLICGVNGSLPGFSVQSPAGEWSGFDVDFCRAIAAAVTTDARNVDFVPLSTDTRFDALASGAVDVLARNTTWTLEREVARGVEFAGVSWYDGQGFMTKADNGLVSAQQLAGQSVCVLEGTTTEQNLRIYLREHALTAEVKTYKDRAEMMAAYQGGACDAVTADRSALFADRTTLADPAAHAVLPEVISREPLGPAVRAGDAEWLRVVRWVLAGMINAEEEGLTKRALKIRMALPASAQRLAEGSMKIADKAGLKPEWLVDVVRQIGCYNDLFEDNLGAGGRLKMERGLNALWRNGGILYAPPLL